MSDKIYSLVYDRKRASEAYQQVDERQIVLAILAGVAPEPSWNESLVYVGDPPDEQRQNVCVAVRGPEAEIIQQRLVEGFEKAGIEVLQIYEGGPEPTTPIAKASEGKWVRATA